jgi:uncharacterized membrane protein
MALVRMVVGLASGFYFWAVGFAFRSLNWFRRQQLVERPTDELLLISAGEAAAMIRRGDVSSSRLVDTYIKVYH